MSSKVLIVDDDKALADSFSVILQSEGYETETAYDGANGIQLAKKFEPDLVLSDMNMPIISGREFQRRIKELNLPTKFIMITGEMERELMKQSMKNGASEFILKPIDPNDLIVKVARILALEDPIYIDDNEAAYYRTQLEVAKERIKYLESLSNELKKGTDNFKIILKIFYLIVSLFTTYLLKKTNLISGDNSAAIFIIVLFILLLLPFDKIQKIAAGFAGTKIEIEKK